MSVRIIIVATLLMVSACSDPADLIIHDANIVDVETGEIQQNKSIEIRDGEIAGIYDQQADLAADETINASGKYVIPGLWDMHVHFRGGDSLAAENKALLDLYVANGVTTVRDAGGDLTTSILNWRKQIQRRELVGPHIYT